MSFSISQGVENQDGNRIETTFQQVDDLLQHGTCIANDIMQVVQLTILTLLPKIILAVREKETSAATCLLRMAEDNTVKIKAHVGEMQQRHVELQQNVFLMSTQSKESAEGCSLTKHVGPHCTKRSPDSPRSVLSTEYVSSDDGELSSDDEYQSLFDRNHESLVYRSPRAIHAIHEIAGIDMAAWQDLAESSQRLTQMRHHASCLVECSSKNEKIRARVEQRLTEYSNVWASLESSCKEQSDVRAKSNLLMQELSSL